MRIWKRQTNTSINLKHNQNWTFKRTKKNIKLNLQALSGT